jgi:hypothetical protein
MSKTKSTLAATLLTLVLAVPSLAGVIGSPASTPPPPPPTVEGSGITGSSGLQAPQSSPELSSQMLIDILIAALSLF